MEAAAGGGRAARERDGGGGGVLGGLEGREDELPGPLEVARREVVAARITTQLYAVVHTIL